MIEMEGHREKLKMNPVISDVVPLQQDFLKKMQVW